MIVSFIRKEAKSPVVYRVSFVSRLGEISSMGMSAVVVVSLLPSPVSMSNQPGRVRSVPFLKCWVSWADTFVPVMPLIVHCIHSVWLKGSSHGAYVGGKVVPVSLVLHSTETSWVKESLMLTPTVLA